MSDRELIGQRVMIRFDGTNDMYAQGIKLIRNYDIGNVFLFGRNIKSFSQTKKMIEKIRSHNKEDIPLFIGVDEEGGSVDRFRGQWKPRLLSAKKLGASNNPKKVYDQYLRIGKKLKSIGIDIVFAPVLDIAHKPSSSFLGNRIFGNNPKKVSALVCKAIDGLHDAGVISLGKHFPGHGDTSVDPHEKLPVEKTTYEQMASYYFLPFQAAIDDGIDAMMVAHISYPNIDKHISTVSSTFLTDILRKRMGFKGVIISDCIEMRAFLSHYPVGEGSVLFILAGGDMVLVGKDPGKQKEVCDSLYKAVQDGRISRERLKESVRWILELKQKYCGLQ